jgi:hypothetical protein
LFNIKRVKTAEARQNLVYNEACERWGSDFSLHAIAGDRGFVLAALA